MKFLKNIFKLLRRRRPSVLDANEVLGINNLKYKPIIYVGNDGRLYYTDPTTHGHIIGSCEWPDEAKKYCGVSDKTTVIDVCIQPIEQAEAE